MNIYYYLDDRGNNLVKEFIESLPLKEQAKIFAYIERIRYRQEI